MPRGQYDRAAARARREEAETNHKSHTVVENLVEYLEQEHGLEITVKDVLALDAIVRAET